MTGSSRRTVSDRLGLAETSATEWLLCALILELTMLLLLGMWYAVQPSSGMIGRAAPVQFIGTSSTNTSGTNLLRTYVLINPTHLDRLLNKVGLSQWSPTVKDQSSASEFSSDVRTSMVLGASVAYEQVHPDTPKMPVVTPGADGTVPAPFEVGDVLLPSDVSAPPRVHRHGRDVVLPSTEAVPEVTLLAEVDPPSPVMEEGMTGTSGGLMLALGYVDLFSPGPLAVFKVGGSAVINADGSLDPVAGLEYKMAAAADEGAKMFLLPDFQTTPQLYSLAQARGIKLVPVRSLQDAVNVLCATGGKDQICETRSAL